MRYVGGAALPSSDVHDHVVDLQVRHVLVERDILTATKTPWLVRLLYAFQDTQHVYLAMEYVPGGDFRTLLNNSGVLKEEHARYYISEMFVAVNELHKLGYIHRDLKPEVRRFMLCSYRLITTVHRTFWSTELVTSSSQTLGWPPEP
jgi:tRNA A-37 threonylcarbamoyl transferase component Bud32